MATMREEIDKYKGQVKAYPAGAPNTAVIPQDDGKFRPAENVAMNPATDRVSSAVGGAARGISKVGESMSGTSGGVAMRGPELRGNMPTTAQLQDKPFNYQQQPGMAQAARGALDVMAKTSGAISMPGAEQPFVNSVRRPIGNDVRTFDPAAVQDKSSMPGMLEGLNTARINAQQERHALVGDIGRGMLDAGGNLVSAVGKFGEDMTEGRLLGANPNVPRQPLPTRAVPDSALPGTKTLAARNPSQPVALETAAPDGKNSWSGNYAAQNADGQGIFTDPATGRTSIRLTGEAGGKFMQDQRKIIADGGGKADTRKAMPLGEYGGMYAQSPRANVPATANPGLTLRATPVEYKRTASDAKVAGGFAASEEFTPQAAPQGAQPQRTAMPAMTEAPAMTGNPLVDQRNMEAALQRKQMEVMAAERADKSLMQAPGSRDYISPMLTEEQQRARQIEIAAQRKQDMRDARDNTIAQMEARDAALAYSGVPSDATRNQSMAPYAARRTDINSRNAMMTRAQEQEKTGATVADNEATRAAEMEKTKITDATTRRGQDVDMETNRINSEIAAQSKALDRRTTMEAAKIKIDNTADPIMLKKVDGYNSWLESAMSMGQVPTTEQMTAAQKTFGVSELFADATTPARPVRPAAR